MLLFLRKKYGRDERLMQLLFLLSLLRGSPDLSFDEESELNELLNYDLPLGSALGHAQLPASLLNQELHPKSLDRVLAGYQRSLLNDLNSLGNFTERISRNNSYGDIHAYLLNAESAIRTPPHTPTEGGYVSGPPSPEIAEQPVQWLTQEHASTFDWARVESEDLLEELDFLEAIWKQDIDLGVPRAIFEDEDEDEQLEEMVSKMDTTFLALTTKDSDPGRDPPGESETEKLPDEKDWAALNFTVDAETGELLAANKSVDPVLEGDGPVLSFAPTDRLGSGPSVSLLEGGSLHLEFNLDEALRLAGLDTSTAASLSEPQEVKDCEADSGCGDSGSSDFGGDSATNGSLDALNESLDEMIQASQLHPHHPRNFQGRLGSLVRGGSMEQRWQDLASLLSLPSPDPSPHHAQSPPTPTMASHATSPVHVHAHPPPPIHHPHALYPGHEGAPVGGTSSPGIPRGVLVHNATMPPLMQDAHNITYTNSIGASSHLVASSMNLANNSDIASNDHHHYKMETSGVLPPPEMMYYQNSTGAEINQTTDGFLSSILNDEDLQLMDIPIADYNGRGGGDYGGGSYRYPHPEDPHRLPPVAQKKHQMFGKRYFHENPHTNHAGPNNIPGNGHNVGSVPPILGPYAAPPPHYATTQPQPMEGATAMDPSEMKYSCTMDFRTPGQEVAGAAVDHVQHNHTYHMSPDGPSGLSRPHSKDRKGRRADIEKHFTRDEKRARSLNLPITCDDIINLPMDEFNERISKFDLTEAQLSLIRDIRRRGKNKVAAQNCRKRKLDQIVHLAEEVRVIQTRKGDLHSQMDYLTAERARIKHKFSLLYRHIFQSLRDPDGNPYSPHDYSLQQSADGSILLVPRSSPPPSTLDQLTSKGRMQKDTGGH